MRWRLLRRCLLFGLLGLVTSVAVAWGTALYRHNEMHARVREVARPRDEGIGLAVRDGVMVRLRTYSLPAWHRERWDLEVPNVWHRSRELLEREMATIELFGGAQYDYDRSREPDGEVASFKRRLDGRAARGVPWRATIGHYIMIDRDSTGWPLMALRSTFQADLFLPPVAASLRAPHGENTITRSWAIVLPWSPADVPPVMGRPFILPLEPRPGLLINTFLYALLWFGLLLIPRAIVRYRRRARGRCPKCGYSLRGQPAPGCPECGSGRRARPSPPEAPTAAAL